MLWCPNCKQFFFLGRPPAGDRPYAWLPGHPPVFAAKKKPEKVDLSAKLKRDLR
jgi:hypothetical protein